MIGIKVLDSSSKSALSYLLRIFTFWSVATSYNQNKPDKWILFLIILGLGLIFFGERGDNITLGTF